LLASERIEDNILAVLAGLEDSVQGIRAILVRIKKLSEPVRQEALQHLLVTCGIRDLAEVCEKELKTMPITLDLSHDPLFASYIERGRLKGEKQGRKKGLLLGQQKGRQKGRREGRVEGVRQVVQLQLEKRFGRLPAPIVKRLAELSDVQVRALALEIIDAKSLKELFASSR